MSIKTDILKKTISINVKDCPTVDWDTLKTYETNTLKKAKDRDVSKLKNAIVNRGFNFPFYIWANHRYVIDGAGRIAALVELLADGYEIPALPIVEITATNLAQAKALVLQVSSEHGIVTQDSFLAFTADLDLEPLLDDINFPDLDLSLETLNPTEPQGDPDEVPEPPEQPFTQLGDVYQIGPHRLMCGDSTQAHNVAELLQDSKPNLMVTDPPYGVSYDSTWRDEAKPSHKPSVNKGKVLNDDIADWREAWALFPGDVAYVWHADLYTKTVTESLEACDFEPKYYIIWNKDTLVLGRGDYHHKHEPVWYVVRQGKTHDWSGDRKQTTVWDIPSINSFKTKGKDEKEAFTGHGTQKPVECMARPMRNHGKPGNIVYDPFGGSGTTMVAAQQEGRTCYMMELSPTYVDMIIARMKKLFPTLKVTRSGDEEEI